MINKSILIAALARDCKKAIIKNIPKIEILRKEFISSHVVIIENDSKDGTKDILKQWEKQSEGVKAIMNNFGTITISKSSESILHPGSSLHRISKMTKYRNMYMDYAKNVDFRIDYLITIDIDIEDFSPTDIIKCIKDAPNDWGGLFANGRTYYYHISKYFDMFAFLPSNSNEVINFKNMITNNHILEKLLRQHKFVECISAFGGIGIYKWDLIKDLHYETHPNKNSKIFEMQCEHISLNKNIINKGYKNYICSSMKVSYGRYSLKECIAFTILPPKILFFLYRLLNKKIDGLNL